MSFKNQTYFKIFYDNFQYFEVATDYYKLKIEKVKLEMEVLTKKQKEGNSDDMLLYCDIFKAHI